MSGHGTAGHRGIPHAGRRTPLRSHRGTPAGRTGLGQPDDQETGAPVRRAAVRPDNAASETDPLGRQLLDDLGPAYAQVQRAIARATATGHGITGELQLGYMSAAVARRVLSLADPFRARTPGCRVSIRETALADLCGPLRRAEVDLPILPLPVAEPDLTVGPVLLSEAALLAVPADHPLAQRPRVTPEELTGQTFLFAQDLPGYWIDHHLPLASAAVTITLLPGFQEMLAYVASGHGVAIVGAQTEQLYPRPGLAYVPIAGEPTYDYAAVWRTNDLSALASAFLDHTTSTQRVPRSTTAGD